MSGYKDKSDLVLKEAERRREKNRIADVEEEKVKVVIFTLAGGWYAFSSGEIKEIISHANIFYVPGAPDFIHGLINIRGDIESVINLNMFLRLPDNVKAQSGRVLVAAVEGGIRSGILVDSVEDVLDIPASSVKSPLSTLNKSVREFVAGEFIHGRETVILLSVEKIFEKITV
ncbi:MAG: purine-binding chemotaxis protein CheW [Nitrospirae bacterium]|nr:purine-binding chemotaxis protein CheW [Nitrospirota bacterium]